MELMSEATKSVTDKSSLSFIIEKSIPPSYDAEVLPTSSVTIAFSFS